MRYSHIKMITSTKILGEIISVYIVFVIMLLISPAFSDTCTVVNSCIFKFSNGSVIDLSTVGLKNEPRFHDIVVKSSNESFAYFYNPCYSFSLGADSGACSSSVAICQKDVTNPNKPSYQDCGDQERIDVCSLDNNNNMVLTYHSKGNRATNVTLKCITEANVEGLKDIRETKLNHYAMTLETICACPDKCRNDGLSTGSSIVIVFFIFVFFYLFFGIIYMNLVRGASGWELIPHHEFWRDLPLLVRDGCVFVCSGCKRETSYERI